ncbi:hypothetical protein [Paraflavitalea speifideaquila]|uniref:hypothetical protein n=1 Tax=Paraflavitalea speifideaquila TaxID=3076558 RepID=UPI0028EB409C|nr:hypothetical protein [Paraflavitalea speifideiaquila]
MTNHSISNPTKITIFILGLLVFTVSTTTVLANPPKELIKIKGEAVGIQDAQKIYLQRYHNKMFL